MPLGAVHPIIASEAKQSTVPRSTKLDRFVASAPRDDGTHTTRTAPSPSLRAQRSNPSCLEARSWIASSLPLLAMTEHTRLAPLLRRHCERSEAIHREVKHEAGSLRCARDDGIWLNHTSAFSRRGASEFCVNCP